jgi:hypothetical protein
LEDFTTFTVIPPSYQIKPKRIGHFKLWSSRQFAEAGVGLENYYPDSAPSSQTPSGFS